MELSAVFSAILPSVAFIRSSSGVDNTLIKPSSDATLSAPCRPILITLHYGRKSTRTHTHTHAHVTSPVLQQWLQPLVLPIMTGSGSESLTHTHRHRESPPPRPGLQCFKLHRTGARILDFFLASSTVQEVGNRWGVSVQWQFTTVFLFFVHFYRFYIVDYY